MTSFELYVRLCDLGIDFEIVEWGDGFRVYKFKVEEENETDETGFTQEDNPVVSP